MDSNSEEGEYQNLEDALPQAMVHYEVSYSHGRNANEGDYGKKEDFKKRCPAGRSATNPGRQKRVVSCKRKTHHVTVARRKPAVPGRTYDMANKENDMACTQDMDQEIFYMDPWEFPPNVNNSSKTGGTSSKHTECVMLTELSKDHSTMTNVLFGRNLRLKVALTLWRRNVGELLTYLLRIQDIGVFVDFLPMMTKSITEDSPRFDIGCCVDVFPLVKKVLAHPYEEYLIVGLKWIQAVLKNWWEELSTSGCSGATNSPLDEHFQVFNQHLLELWCQQPFLKSLPGTAGDMAKDIDCFSSQLT